MATLRERIQARLDRLNAERTQVTTTTTAQLATLDAARAEASSQLAALTPAIETIYTRLIAAGLVKETTE